jgi:hypothetical protein
MVRRVSCVLLLVACCALPLASGGGAEAQTAVGDGVEASLPIPYPRLEDMSDARLDALLDKAKSAGVSSVHTQADWWILEPRRDDYRWSYMDRFVNEARARGLKVSMQLTSAPPWVSPAGQWYPPRDSTDLASWRDFVNDLVARYGTRVAHYEMWNEPNHPTFWAGNSGPNPAEYAALLRTGYLGAKAANPDVRVTGGMLAHNDIGYLKALYTAIRRYPDAAANDDFFDELGLHPYSHKGSIPLAPNSTVESTFQAPFGLRNTNFWGYRYMRNILVDHGDPHKKIYLGEFGYNTKAAWTSPITDAQRAAWLKEAFAVANTNSSYISGLDWYSYYADASRGFNIVDPSTLAESATFKALREVAGGASSTTRTLSFAPTADARVEQALPSRNLGTSDTLTADADSGGWRLSFLKFDVSGVRTETVQRATLHLYVKNSGGSVDGPAVRRSANEWTEGGVSWNTRPVHLSEPQDDKGAVAGASWVAFDVTNLVRGDGTVTLAVQPTSTDDTYTDSREGTNKPKLVLRVGS